MGAQENVFADESENRRIETFKALNALALELFKALNVLNAGAATGMLAGIDKLQCAIERTYIEQSIAFFVFGLVFGLCAMLFGWFALYRRLHLMDEPSPKPSKYKRMMIATLVSAALGLICFCFGALIVALNLHSSNMCK